MLIAIPSEAPGGMDAQVSAHFGHCAAFTLVSLEDNKVEKVGVLPNLGHEQGGCMAPVMFLKEHGAEVLMAGGMGARPLMGFQQVGITVYFNEGAATVSECIKHFIAGTARVFGPAQVCGGGGDSGGGCGGH